MTVTIYGFLADQALYRKTNIGGISKIIPTQNVDQGVGYLSDAILDMLVSGSTMNDPRTTRSTVLAEPCRGSLMMVFDQDKVGDGDFTTMTSDEITAFMKIVEVLTYTQSGTIGTLNTTLAADPVTYAGYVEGSASFATERTSATVSVGTSNSTTAWVRNWVQFSFTFGTGPDAVTNIFKIWLSGSLFLANYPLTTITKVVLPCPVAQLRNPQWDSFLLAIQSASAEINTVMVSEIATKEHTGMTVSSYSYVTGGNTTPIALPFGVLYKGRAPTDSEISAAIIYELTGGDTDQYTFWGSVFPGLFLANTFYLIPYWTNTRSVNGSPVDLAVAPVSTLLTAVGTVLEVMDAGFLSTHREFLQAPGYKLPIVAVPAESNTIATLKNATLLNTYIATSSTDTTYTSQTADEQLFSVRLATAIGLLKAGATEYPVEYANTTDSGRQYLSFVVGTTKYFLLKPVSFPS